LPLVPSLRYLECDCPTSKALSSIPQNCATTYYRWSTFRVVIKRAFFQRFGFSIANAELLTQALLVHARAHDVAKIEDSPYGKRYVIDGILEAPNGRNPMLRVVWFIDAGRYEPRFVTAYPLEWS